MYRVGKLEGVGNIVVEEAPVPEIGETEVLIRAETSLISRGSEIWRRYVHEEAIDHRIMGYSMVGSIAEVGSMVDGFSPGERVAALAPHAEFVAVEVVKSASPPRVVALPEEVASESATFWPLATSSILWMEALEARVDETVAILGQGLVGSGCLQALKARVSCRVIAVDGISDRCRLALKLGADEVVDVSKEDSTEAVRRLTGERGADRVVYAVGGRSGHRAFEEALEMVRKGGLIQIIGLYEEGPLPLSSSSIQGKRLIGGYPFGTSRREASDKAIRYLAEGRFRVVDMISHRFPFQQAPEAYDLLYNRLHEAMGVLLQWR